MTSFLTHFLACALGGTVGVAALSVLHAGARADRMQERFSRTCDLLQEYAGELGGADDRWLLTRRYALRIVEEVGE